jgi:peptidoglycan-associated lipoprotein
MLLAGCVEKSDETAGLTGNGTGYGDGGAGHDESPTGTPLGAGDAGSQQEAEQELQSQVGDTIHFIYNSSDITGEARVILERQAAYMQKYGALSFTIEGHCDERGTREYNLALGEKRANAAKNALVALGVAPARLQTISYGKERPVAVGSSEAAFARNRRAVTVVD